MPRVKKVAAVKKRGRKKIVKPHAKAIALHQTLTKSLMDLKKYWNKQATSLKKQQVALTAKLKKALVKQKKIKTAKAHELVERFQTALEEARHWIEEAKENISKYTTLQGAMDQVEPKSKKEQKEKKEKKEKPKAKPAVKAKKKANAAVGKKRGRKPKAQVVAAEDFDMGSQASEEEDIFGLDSADDMEDFESEDMESDADVDMEESMEEEEGMRY